MAVLQNIKKRFSTWSRNSTSWYTFPGEFKAGSERDIYMPRSLATLFTISRRWNQLRCPSTDEWMNEMGVYFTRKLTHAETGLNPENCDTCSFKHFYGIYTHDLLSADTEDPISVRAYVCEMGQFWYSFMSTWSKWLLFWKEWWCPWCQFWYVQVWSKSARIAR